MCIVCVTGTLMRDEGQAKLIRVATNVIEYPLASDKAQERVINAVVEAIIASQLAYGFEIVEGKTEDELRDRYTQMFREAQAKHRANVTDLADKLGLKDIATMFDNVRNGIAPNVCGDEDDIFNDNTIFMKRGVH